MARLLLLSIIVLLGLGLAWIVVSGLLAERELTAAQHGVSQLRNELAAADLDRLSSTSQELRTHAHRAHRLTTGPAWWLAAHVPWAGDPLESARGCAQQADALGSQVLAPMVTVANSVTLGNLVVNGSVRLAPIQAAAPTVRHADTELSSASAAVDKLPGNTWLGPVNRGRQRFVDSLDSLRRQVGALDRVTSVLPQMLGSSQPKRYFIGFENEAESRGLGGIPGAFVIVTADRGHVSVSQFESDTTLDKVRTDLDLGADYARRYGQAEPASTYPNSTISPDFSDAGRIWAAMWQKYSGQHIDGAVAIDPTALSYLLKVTGPARLADGQQVSAANVVSLTQRQLYSRYPDVTQRKAYLILIAKAISNKLLTAHGSTALVNAAGRAAGERRLLVWSADSTTQKVLAGTAAGGLLTAGNGPFASFSTVNATGGKLDYYLARTMSYRRTSCAAGSPVTATLTLTNAVAPGPLPAYVTIRADKPGYPTKPGDNKVLVSYYATPGSKLGSVAVDGHRTTLAAGTEKGLAVYTLTLELPRGSTHTVTVQLTEPRSGAVRVQKQPSVIPERVSVTEPACT